MCFSLGSVHGDVTFNVGGPVWAMDWCPVPGRFCSYIFNKINVDLDSFITFTIGFKCAF